jgi:hypothetical protein
VPVERTSRRSPVMPGSSGKASEHLLLAIVRRPTFPALGHNQSDVVVLFMGAEAAHFINNRRDHGLWRQFSMPFSGLGRDRQMRGSCGPSFHLLRARAAAAGPDGRRGKTFATWNHRPAGVRPAVFLPSSQTSS